MEKTKKPIAVFDIDGTIFRSSLLVEITKALIDIGVFPPKASQIYLADYRAWRNRTGLYETYLDKVITSFEQNVKGVRVDILEAISSVVIDNLSLETYRYTREFIKQLGRTHFLVAISGSPDVLVSLFSKKYGFDDFAATTYKTQDEIYIEIDQKGHQDKDKSVKRMLKKHSLSLAGSVGVGDTESDIAFLEIVGRPIAFNPNQKLLSSAATRGWQIVVERKDVVYELKPNSDKTYQLLQS